jgi:DNA-directed RNA polymerase subunit omega
MARVTVEDCLQQVDNQYDLVILAKERTLQLGVGDAPQVPVDNDKRTVLALREIAEKKVSVKDLEESTIDRMRDHPDDAVEQEDFDSPDGDSFEDLYQGEVSKSGQAILPSKRSRKIPDPKVGAENEAIEADDDDLDDDIALEAAPEKEATEDKV